MQINPYKKAIVDAVANGIGVICEAIMIMNFKYIKLGAGNN